LIEILAFWWSGKSRRKKDDTRKNRWISLEILDATLLILRWAIRASAQSSACDFSPKEKKRNLLTNLIFDIDWTRWFFSTFFFVVLLFLMALRRILTRARQDAPIKMSVFLFFCFPLIFPLSAIVIIIIAWSRVPSGGQRQFGVDVRRVEEDKSQKAGQEFFFFLKGIE
jgi:hypothetical protein